LLLACLLALFKYKENVLKYKGQNCDFISNNIVVLLQNCQNAFKYKGQNHKLLSNKIVLLLAYWQFLSIKSSKTILFESNL
jgi:hypothetical protein